MLDVGGGVGKRGGSFGVRGFDGVAGEDVSDAVDGVAWGALKDNGDGWVFVTKVTLYPV